MTPSTTVENGHAPHPPSGGVMDRIEEERRAIVLRQDATRMKWSELCRPERKAIRDLLARLYKAAVDLQADELAASRGDVRVERATSTALLVSGDRGTGKTTVLLNAAYATQEPSHFFQDSADVAKAEEYVAKFMWLDPLDMELLPRGANLLTTLLVRIRDVLLSNDLDGRDHAEAARHGGPRRIAETGEGVRRAGVPPRLLEESDTLLTAWEALDELVRVGTTMWEGVAQAADVRRSADPQIAAAETYSNFQKNAREALDRAIAEIARQHRRFGGRPPIVVLPIDNVDRSAMHASEVIKLMRMVPCPHLWFVLAASHDDLDVFVEASYAASLTPAAASGKSMQADLQQIARRQAAAMVATNIPPAHRVEVEPMQPDEVLRFEMPDPSDASKAKTLEDLLRIKLRARSELAPGDPQTLLDLIAFKKSAAPGEKETYDPFPVGTYDLLWDAENRNPKPEKPLWFTHAGKNALTLPVRRFVDLWQAAKRWRDQQDRRTEEDPAYAECAIELVHEMLNSATVESALPTWACDLLRRRVVYRRKDENRVCIDLRENPLKCSTSFSVRDVIDIPFETGDRWLSSREVFHEYYGLAVRIRNIADRGADRTGSKEAPKSAGAEGEPQAGDSCELDSTIRPWLMFLYDMLRRAPNRRIEIDTESATELYENPVLVQTQHRVVLGDHGISTLDMDWTMPAFDTFYQVDLVTQLWKAFMWYLLPSRGSRSTGAPGKEADETIMLHRFESVDKVVRFFVTAWLDAILLTTFTASRDKLGGKVWDVLPKGGSSEPVLRIDEERLEAYENDVYATLHDLYRTTRCPADGTRRGEDVSHRWSQARRWIERGAFLLRMPEFMGAVKAPRVKRDESDALNAYWERNKVYLADKRFEGVLRAIERADGASKKDRPRATTEEGHEVNPHVAARRWFETVAKMGPADPWRDKVDPLPVQARRRNQGSR